MSALVPERGNVPVEIWVVGTQFDAALEESLARCLTSEERRRIAQRRQPADRRRHLVSRGMLRHVLSCRLDMAPAQVEIALSSAGKPELAGASQRSDLHFNVSHSGEKVVIALAELPVGVDVEQTTDVLDWQDAVALAQQWFEPEEASRVVQEPSCFLSIWTAKEAVLKAQGRGITAGLKGFVVPASLAQPGLVRRCAPENGTTPWYVSSFEVGAAYCGALAVGYRPACLQVKVVQVAEWLAAHTLS